MSTVDRSSGALLTGFHAELELVLGRGQQRVAQVLAARDFDFVLSTYGFEGRVQLREVTRADTGEAVMQALSV